jgi:LPS sulfotransferase NodH
MSTSLNLSKEAIENSKTLIPKEDFVASTYDACSSNDATHVYIILSTPRSGSTYLSSLLYQQGLSLPHEYFHAPHYLPILADRWKCIGDGNLDREKYVKELISHRTDSQGILGVNLHGDHLELFSEFESYLSDKKTTFYRLFRRDSIAQAVSLSLAWQTGAWSRHFRKTQEASYSFEHILTCIASINRQNLIIDSYLRTRGKTAISLYYEDIIKSPADVLSTISDALGVPNTHREILPRTELEVQRTNLNNDWIQRFSLDYLKRWKS